MCDGFDDRVKQSIKNLNRCSINCPQCSLSYSHTQVHLILNVLYRLTQILCFIPSCFFVEGIKEKREHQLCTLQKSGVLKIFFST